MSLPATEELSALIQEAVKDNDPTAFLLADHAWVRDVLDELRDRLSGPSAGIFSGDVEEFANAIDLHIRREEEAFFPALEPIVKAMGIGSTDDMYGEHDAIRICLEKLQAAISHFGDTHAALAALRRSLVVHFDNEEELLFYEPASRLSQEARREVLRQFEELAKG